MRARTAVPAVLAALFVLAGCDGSGGRSASPPSGTPSQPAGSAAASPSAGSQFAGRTLTVMLHPYDLASGLLSFRLATRSGQYQYSESGPMHRLALPRTAHIRSWGWCGGDRPSRPDGTGLIDCDLSEMTSQGDGGDIFDGSPATMTVGDDDTITSLRELWHLQP